jgi:hypothetical protein
MTTVRGALLRRQFEVTWGLFEYHLESDPVPVPTVPTVAWLCWCIDRWWGTAIDGIEGRTPWKHEDVQPQSDAAAVVARLRERRAEWLRLLEDLEDARLDEVSVVLCGEGSMFTVADTWRVDEGRRGDRPAVPDPARCR